MRGFAVTSAVGLLLLSAGCSGVKTAGATTGGGAVTLTEVVPTQGPLAGHVPVEIHGTGFVSGNLLVTFGGTAVADATVVDAQTIRGTLPPRSQAGAVDVSVACAGGQAALPHGFTYAAAAAISITGINPPNGPIGGGTTVTITGTGLSAGATAVSFGSNSGTSVTVTSDTQLTVVTPAAAQTGAVSVTISNNNGSASLPNAFVYGDVTTTTGTVAEHLGGISEFDYIEQGSSAAVAGGSAIYFAASDVLYPAPGSCMLDLNMAPGVTSTLDAGANVQITMGTQSTALPKNTTSGNVRYTVSNAPATGFVMGAVTGIQAPGATLAAFSNPAVATAPAADFTAWLDPLHIFNFTGGGVWSGHSDLWVSWTATDSVNHVQLMVVGADAAGAATHVLQCDLRAGGDTGSFCIRGGNPGSDLCQTPGASMTDFWNAIGGAQLGFGSSTVVLYRGNRSTYDLGNGSSAALDVNVVRAASLVMTN